MITAIGILSILAGIFVFKQGTALSLLSGLAQSTEATTISGAFLIVAICMILSGVLSCCSKNGEKSGFIKATIASYFLAALVGFIYNKGDLRIWSIVCLVIGVILIIKLVSRKEETVENNSSENKKTSISEQQTVPLTETSTAQQIKPVSSLDTREIKDPRWKTIDGNYTCCPDCGNRLSLDYIKVRGYCPDCKCAFYIKETVDKEEKKPKTEDEISIRQKADTSEKNVSWAIVDKNFTICPECGKRMSIDFIKARGRCMDCKHPFRMEDLFDPASIIENEEKQKAIWTRDKDGFTKCPNCDAYMSFDFILAKRKCPKCGQDFA